MRALLLALMLVSAQSWGADKSGSYTGTAPSCADVVAVARERDKSDIAKVRWITIGWWIHGYVVAYNTFTPDTYDVMGDTDLRTVLQWMTAWCEKNTLRNSGHAMEVLMQELYPRRRKTGKQ